MTRSDIINHMAEKYRLSPKIADLIVKNILNTLGESLVSHRRIEIRDFGSFDLKHRKQRQVRNPKTGDVLQAPATYAVHFKPGKALKARVDASRIV